MRELSKEKYKTHNVFYVMKSHKQSLLKNCVVQNNYIKLNYSYKDNFYINLLKKNKWIFKDNNKN